MKKSLLIRWVACVICMMVMMPTMSVWAAEEDFVIENGTLVKYVGTDTDVVIPEGVTTIGCGVFCNMNITSVTIPNSVKCIEHSAFKMTNLTSVIIPEGVETIGSFAFMNCPKLESVSVPASATNIGCSVFENTPWQNTKLAKNDFFIVNGVLLAASQKLSGDIEIPNNVRIIQSFSCDYLYNITSVTVPNSVTDIGESAFEDCFALKYVVIPKSVTSISEFAFVYLDYENSSTYDWKNLDITLYVEEGSNAQAFAIEHGYTYKDISELNESKQETNVQTPEENTESTTVQTPEKNTESTTVQTPEKNTESTTAQNSEKNTESATVQNSEMTETETETVVEVETENMSELTTEIGTEVLEENETEITTENMETQSSDVGKKTGNGVVWGAALVGTIGVGGGVGFLLYKKGIIKL